MSTPPGPARTLLAAAGLALAAAVSLGLARFSYALLLPPMRADLGWSYLAAGAMNTVNAAGYLLGALLAPRWIAGVGPRAVLLSGGIGSALLLAAHGGVVGTVPLLALRAATGIASAATFVSGGLLAARAAGAGHPRASAGLVLGLYYGGTGVGIVAATLLVPPLAGRAVAHAWQAAWIGLGACALVFTVGAGFATRGRGATMPGVRAAAPQGPDAPLRRVGTGRSLLGRFGFGLAAYFLFGLGYIGYMTFVVTLLREDGLGDTAIVVFYGLLGVAVVASSFVWAGLLERHRGGGALRRLCGLLAIATLLPVFGAHPALVTASGLLFGGVFLSVVAATTALVRHNLPPEAWPAGIAAFTIVFASGQIVGPALTGWLADGPAGLRGGLAASAGVLAIAALLAGRQRPLDSAEGG